MGADEETQRGVNEDRHQRVRLSNADFLPVERPSFKAKTRTLYILIIWKDTYYMNTFVLI